MKKEADLRASEAVRRALDGAFRRHRRVILASEAPVALAVALCGLLLIVLAGTSLLNPVWLIVFAAAAIAVAAVRIRSRALTPYSVAQAMDARLHLNDALSTACFLLSGERQLTPAAVFQIETTAAMANRVSPREAFPFVRSRAWWVVLALLIAVALSILGRYAALGSLDLRAPVLRIPAMAQIRPNAHEIPKRPLGAIARRLNVPALPALDPVTAPADTATQSKQAGNGGASAEAIRNLEQQLQAQENNGSHESLLDRAGDAMRGLGSELKQAVTRNQSSAKRDTAQPGASSDAAAQTSSKPPQGDRSGAQNDGHGEEHEAAKAEARAVENHTGTPLGPADQAAQEKGSDAQSGAGRDEGQKTIQDSEQLKAVGKLEQIIGKRSASITGEMHLAKSSHDQQLQTQYSNRVGEHSDRGGEIHHDQVPPQYRDYIRAYMDAVHGAAEHGH